jgi:tetratricopeptide (TPR) repeat protein
VGLILLYPGIFYDAEKHFRNAIDPVKRLSDRLSLPVDRFSTSVWMPWYFGWWYHDLAETLTAMGRLEEAEEVRRLSLAAWESAGTAVAAIIPHGKGLAHYRLGELLQRTGDTEEAGRQFVHAQATMEDLARRRPDESACHWQIICLLANCPDPALRDPRRAVTLAKHVLPARAGHYWRYLALAQYRSGDWQDAADSIRQAMDLRQGGDALDWLLLAMAEWQLGQKEEALERYTQAQEAIEASKPIYYEYIGVMAVDRLRSEAEMLLAERIGVAEEE